MFLSRELVGDILKKVQKNDNLRIPIEEIGQAEYEPSEIIKALFESSHKHQSFKDRNVDESGETETFFQNIEKYLHREK